MEHAVANKGKMLESTMQLSTRTAGATASRHRLHRGSGRRGTTALSREDTWRMRRVKHHRFVVVVVSGMQLYDCIA